MKVLKTIGLGILTAHYLAILESVLLALFLLSDFAVEGAARGWTSTVAGATQPELIICDCWYVLGTRVVLGFCAIDGVILALLLLSEFSITAACAFHVVVLLLLTWAFEPEIARQVLILRLPLYEFGAMPFLALAAAVSPVILSRIRFIPNTMSKLRGLNDEPPTKARRAD